MFVRLLGVWQTDCAWVGCARTEDRHELLQQRLSAKGISPAPCQIRSNQLLNMNFEAGRPVQATAFDYSALDAPQKEKTDGLRDELQTVWEWFEQRYEWILAGRTARSREIRRAIVRSTAEGKTFGEIARRLGITRQAVHKQALKLTRVS
jgi:hypothetical protein